MVELTATQQEWLTDGGLSEEQTAAVRALLQGSAPPANQVTTPVTGAQIEYVKFRAPTFAHDDPEIWFMQLERNFKAANVRADSIKFDLAFGALPPRMAVEVRDIMKDLPDTKQYESLKNKVITRFGTTAEEKLKKFLDKEELGDRKPSAFLRQLQHYVGDDAVTVSDSVLRTAWLSRLPKSVQMTLVAHKDLSLEKTAEIADSLIDFARAQVPNIAAVQKPASHESELLALISGLQKQIAELSTQNRGRPRERQRSRSNSRRERSASSAKKYDICWYHYRFGDDAKKCQPPCKKSPEN